MPHFPALEKLAANGFLSVETRNNKRGVLVAQLVLRHSCVADRLPVVVRFPAGRRVSLQSGDQPKGRWRRPKKETRNNKRAMLSFKATVEVPMLGTMIESCGDTLDESHMPLGWPFSIDGAVRQFCMHKRATIQELNDMLAASGHSVVALAAVSWSTCCCRVSSVRAFLQFWGVLELKSKGMYCQSSKRLSSDKSCHGRSSVLTSNHPTRSW